MRESRGIDTLVGAGVGLVVLLSALFAGVLVWLLNHGATANQRTVPLLSGASVWIAVSLIAGVEGILKRRGETGMVVRFVLLLIAALALGGFLSFVSVKLLTPGH